MEHTTTLTEGQPAVGLYTHTHTHTHGMDNVHYFSSLLGITHTQKKTSNNGLLSERLGKNPYVFQYRFNFPKYFLKQVNWDCLGQG